VKARLIATVGPVGIDLDMRNPESTARLLALVADIRKSVGRRHNDVSPVGGDEHSVEYRVMHGSLKAYVGETRLWPVDAIHGPKFSSQFPATWSNGDEPDKRYADIILRDGRTPWVTEVKARKSPPRLTSYYEGLVQTVLYTDYVRSARPVYDWFERRGLDAASARGVLAIPPLTPHSRNSDVLTHTSSLAKALGVEFCELRRR